MSTPLDLGVPVAHEGRCDACRCDDRPLWAHEGRVRCASCWTRELPGRAITFRSGGRVVVATQPTMPGLVA